MKTSALAKSVRKYKLFYLLILPGMLYYVVFHYVPMYGIIIAFKDVSPFQSVGQMLSAPFVGLKHFKNFFSSYYFWQVIRNTLLLGGYRIIFGVPAPIILALLLNEIKSSCYKRLVQTISYMPHFISMVVLASLVSMLTSTQGGAINEAIEFFGGKPVNFMGDPKYFRSVLVVSNIWKELGWGTIVYLAAISGINPELYEAATVDGCGRLRQAFSITLPSIAGTISILLILSVTSFINAGFEQVLLMYNTQVYEVADIIDTFVYRQGILNLNYSYSTAIGLFKSVIAAVLMLGTNAIVRRMGQQGIW